MLEILQLTVFDGFSRNSIVSCPFFIWQFRYLYFFLFGNLIPSFHLAKIKREFVEQLPDYQLVKLLNKNGSFRISSKLFTHSRKGFSSYVKNIIIETYEVRCNIVNCISCRIQKYNCFSVVTYDNKKFVVMSHE